MTRSPRPVLLGALLLALACTILGACQKPVTHPTLNITLWHNYFGGGPMQQRMDELIDQFNRSEGQQAGIHVSATLIGTSSDLSKNIEQILREEPGAPELPNVAIFYPQTAYELRERGLLLDLSSAFSDEERAAFVPAFLEEGTIDGELCVLPANKSTEVLFVNETYYRRYFDADGSQLQQLQNLRRLFEVAVEYARVDPAEQNLNRPPHFLAIDSWFNFFHVVLEQQDADLFDAAGQISAGDPAFLAVWDPFAAAALTGGLSLYDGYASEQSRVGEIIASIGSTAGVLYYGSEVTSRDGRTTSVSYRTLPFPVIPGATPTVIQRGGGLVVTRSDAEHEAAAIRFLKWFTESSRNEDFTRGSGYMPVKRDAWGQSIAASVPEPGAPMLNSLVDSYIDMVEHYCFTHLPVTDRSHILNEDFEATARRELLRSREELAARTSRPSDEELKEAGRTALERILKQLVS